MIADRIIIENNEIVFRLDLETAGANAAELAVRARDEAIEAASQAADIAKRYNFITPNMFAGQGMTDQQKVQEALLWAIQKKKSLYIPWNEERDSDIWLLDEAVLLPSNSIIYIDNARLKLSDIARDNIFRSANCGIGIENPFENPLHNISIIGIGNAVIEGADNPRSTGDSTKVLSLNVPDYTTSGNNTYGTDAGNTNEKQTGDWRNIGIILAYTNGIKLQGFTMRNIHAYGISCERSKNGIIRDIFFDNDENRIYNGQPQIVKNTDGIDIRYSGSGFTIENIQGKCGDDPVALTTINITGGPQAGSLESITATGDEFNPALDVIHDVHIQNVKTSTYTNIVRILNAGGARMYNINVRDVVDTSVLEYLTRPPRGAAVLVGDSSLFLGGASQLGECYNITLDNVKSVNMRYNVRVLGSIAESTIININKKQSSIQNQNYPAIYIDPTSNGARNLYKSNIYSEGNSSVLDGISQGTWTTVDENGKLIISGGPLNMADNYAGSFTDLSYTNKAYVDAAVSAAIYSRIEGKAIVDAVNTRATIEGFTKPSTALQKILAELIGELMATGSWDKTDLLLNFVFADIGLSQYSRINWKNPTGYLAELNGGLTFSEYGYKGDGSTGFINTRFNPATQGINYTLNNAGRGGIVYFHDFSIFDGMVGHAGNSILLSDATIHNINSGVSTISSRVNLSGTGYKGINRDNNQNIRLRDKAVEYARTLSSTVIYNAEQVILQRGSTFSTNGISMYHMGASLTKSETEGMRNAYNSFLVKLGLNPIA